ncbi:hypothetical protein F4778DRAFT_775704 [Xylariomycetidae sp. FL2044]|nr:hypothetical protein F4778DRAFT_775704 [Xylariomycetidae sp. FL2044]
MNIRKRKALVPILYSELATMQTAAEETHAIKESIEFLKWNDLYREEKPFQIFINIPEDAADQRATNLSWEAKSKVIVDARHNISSFSLDNHGFAFRTHPSRLGNLSDVSKDDITNSYLPEVEEIIKAELGSSSLKLRRAERSEPSDIVDLNNPMDWLLPARQAHSPAAVVNRIRLQFPPDEADKLLTSRVRVINVWRPIKHVVEDWPLGLCDGSSIHETDLVESDHVRRHYIGSTLYLLDRPRHRWYWLSRQSPDEIAMFKNFDSAIGVRAQRAPHASFRLSGTRPDAVHRSSIEGDVWNGRRLLAGQRRLGVHRGQGQRHMGPVRFTQINFIVGVNFRKKEVSGVVEKSIEMLSQLFLYFNYGLRPGGHLQWVD